MSKQLKPIIHGRDHAPDGADPIPGLPNPAGQDIADMILGFDPAGFWKLDEISGTTAHDSSGNDHHMNPPGITNPPTWGQPAGPPGDTTALWPISPSTEVREQVTITPPFTDNFSAGIWAKPLAGGGAGELLGQGTPIHVSGSSTGWCLYLNTSDKIAVFFGNGSVIYSNAAPTVDTWYFVAVVRDAGTWKLYVNGLLQTATSTGSPGAGSTDTWIGNDGFASHGNYAQNILLSYAFITGQVLHSTDLLGIYDAAASGGSAAVGEGLVWTADGAGGADWAPPIPVGGTAGQVLTKDTATDYDTSWQTPTGGGGGAPTGPAGGVLDGSYPNPGLAATVAGAGLAETSDVLSVNVDGSTLEVASDAVRVKDDGITAAKIAADAVGSSEIAAGAVGPSELADTTVAPGSYGDATHVGQFTVDQDGRLTSAANVAVSAGGGLPAVGAAGEVLTVVSGAWASAPPTIEVEY